MKLIYILIASFTCKAYAPAKDIKTVPVLDLRKYQGVWYEIARKPFRPENGLKNITASYTIISDSNIEVINKGVTSKGVTKKTKGKAFRPNPNDEGKLKVKFFGIFAASYWVIELDTVNYQYAVISGPTGKYLWILNREPFMDEKILSMLIEKAKYKGIDVSNLIKTEQEW